MNNSQAATGRSKRRGRTPWSAPGRYAGAKWGCAPAPAALPPPPAQWRDSQLGLELGQFGRCRPEPDRALPLKLLLNLVA